MNFFGLKLPDLETNTPRVSLRGTIRRAKPVRFAEPHLNAFGMQCYCTQRSDSYNAHSSRSNAAGSDRKGQTDVARARTRRK
jgi:hypothetical protein